jgi:hypothetical protein
MKSSYIVAAAIYVLVVVAVWYRYGVAEAVVPASTIIFPVLLFLANAYDNRNINNNVNSDDEGQTSNFESVIETFDERKERAIERLEPHFILRETTAGDIELSTDTEEIRGADRAAMMWVFARWALAETNPEYEKVLTVEELRHNTGLKGGAVRVFLNKMEHFLVRHYPEDPEDRHEMIDGELVRMDEAEMEFELNEEHLEDIADYILGERDAPN